MWYLFSPTVTQFFVRFFVVHSAVLWYYQLDKFRPSRATTLIVFIIELDMLHVSVQKGPSSGIHIF